MRLVRQARASERAHTMHTTCCVYTERVCACTSLHKMRSSTFEGERARQEARLESLCMQLIVQVLIARLTKPCWLGVSRESTPAQNKIRPASHPPAHFFCSSANLSLREVSCFLFCSNIHLQDLCTHGSPFKRHEHAEMSHIFIKHAYIRCVKRGGETLFSIICCYFISKDARDCFAYETYFLQ
jgi:hypothetical protein